MLQHLNHENRNSYHKNLTRWVTNSILDLCDRIPNHSFWIKNQYGNSPGWTLGHLIIENRLMTQDLDHSHSDFVFDNKDDFVYGSTGEVVFHHDKNLLMNCFKRNASHLSQFFDSNFTRLSTTMVSNHPMGIEFESGIDEYLHLLITHPAMHLSALVKWERLLKQ